MVSGTVPSSWTFSMYEDACASQRMTCSIPGGADGFEVISLRAAMASLAGWASSMEWSSVGGSSHVDLGEGM